MTDVVPVRRRAWERRPDLPPGQLEQIFAESTGPAFVGERTEDEIRQRIALTTGLAGADTVELMEDFYGHEYLDPILSELVAESPVAPSGGCPLQRRSGLARGHGSEVRDARDGRPDGNLG